MGHVEHVGSTIAKFLSMNQKCCCVCRYLEVNSAHVVTIHFISVFNVTVQKITTNLPISGDKISSVSQLKCRKSLKGAVSSPNPPHNPYLKNAFDNNYKMHSICESWNSGNQPDDLLWFVFHNFFRFGISHVQM